MLAGKIPERKSSGSRHGGLGGRCAFAVKNAGRDITKRYISSTLNAQNGYANTTALVGK